jgi:hypothetical protein
MKPVDVEHIRERAGRGGLPDCWVSEVRRMLAEIERLREEVRRLKEGKR